MNGRRLLLRSALVGLLAASAVAAPSLAHADERPSARVHIRSSVPVTLERHVEESESWEFACAAPCDEVLPLAGEYRLNDATQRVGDSIGLRAAPGGEVTLTYTRTSVGAKVGGGLLVGAGSLLAAAGTVGLVEGVVILAASGGCGVGSSDWCGLGQAIGAVLTVVGGVGVLGGAGMIVGGVSLLSGSGPSTTQQSKEKTSFVRKPTWTASRASSTPAPAAFIPLLVSF